MEYAMVIESAARAVLGMGFGAVGTSILLIVTYWVAVVIYTLTQFRR